MKRWSQHRHELRLIQEISITPLLDVVLVLLFVFMLAAPLMQNGGSLSLPTAAGKSNEPAPADIATLEVDAAQTLRLNGHALPHSALRTELVRLQQERPGLGVLVRIHRELPVQTLVELMDQLRQAGVQRTAVATQGEPR